MTPWVLIRSPQFLSDCKSQRTYVLPRDRFKPMFSIQLPQPSNYIMFLKCSHPCQVFDITKFIFWNIMTGPPLRERLGMRVRLAPKLQMHPAMWAA